MTFVASVTFVIVTFGLFVIFVIVLPGMTRVVAMAMRFLIVMVVALVTLMCVSGVVVVPFGPLFMIRTVVFTTAVTIVVVREVGPRLRACEAT